MSLGQVIFLLFLVFLGLEYMVLPFLRRQMRARPNASAIPRIATIAALSYLRTAALVMLLSAGALYAFLAVLVYRSQGLEPAEFVQIRDMLQRWQVRFAWFSPAWAIFACLAALVAMATLAYRRAKLRLKEVHQKILDREIERLKEQQASGTWEELPPTPDMQKVAIAVSQADALYQTLGADESWKKKQLEDQIGKLIGLYRQLDIQRRLQMDFAREDLEVPRPRTWSGRFQTFFFSQGWLQSLRGFSHALAIVSLALIPICLVGFQAPQASSQLAARIQNVNQLIVNFQNETQLAATRERAESEWKAVTAAAMTEEAEVSAEDLEIIDDIARAYEHELAESDLGSQLPRFNARQAYQLSALDTRDAILRRAEERAPSQRTRRPSLEDAPGLNESQKEIVKDFRKAANSTELQTKAGRSFKAELVETARTKPQLWQKMKSKAVAWMGSFQTPAADANWRAFLLQRSLDGVDLDAAAQTFEEVERARRAETLRALGDETTPVEHAFKAAQSSPPADTQLQRYNSLKETIASKSYRSGQVQDAIVEAMPVVEQHPPAMDAPQVSQVNTERIRKRYEEFVAELEKSHPRTVDSTAPGAAALDEPEIRRIRELDRQAQAHIRYDDHFPSQLGSEGRTEIGRLNERLSPWTEGPPPSSGGSGLGGGGSSGGGGGGGGGGARRTASRRSVFSFTRARSFRGLRGFARIGGVLIGRSLSDDAEDNETIAAEFQVRDISWEIQGDKVRLSLVDHEGKEYTSQWHDRMLVEQALAYAADGRATTVTMVTTEAISELRILLHPVLVDTELGTSAINLDRLVDKYTGDKDFRHELEDSVQFQLDLYRYAWAKRILTLQPLQCFDGALEDRVTLAEALIQDMNERSAEEGFSELLGSHTAALLRDPTRSILAAKQKQYFDADLVECICNSAGTDNLSEFGNSVQLETRRAFSRRVRDAGTFSTQNLILEGLNSNNSTDGTEAFDAAIAFYADHPNAVEAFNDRVERFNSDVGFGIASESEREDLQRTEELLNKYEGALRTMLAGCIFTPPTFVIWSGVREQTFAANADSLLLQEGQSPSGQLEFMLQVAFTSAPYFQQKLQSEEDFEEIENANDTDPWQFPAIAADIQNTVAQSLSAEDEQIVRQMNEFAILQRLFRLALGGELGQAFPIHKLAELHGAVAQGEKQPYSRTLRWNARPGRLEMSLWQSWLLLSSDSQSGDTSEGETEVSPEKKASGEILELLKEATDHWAQLDQSLEAMGSAESASESVLASMMDQFNTTMDQFEQRQIDWERRFAAAVMKFQHEFFADSPDAQEVQFLTRAVDLIQDRRDLAVYLDDRQLFAEQIGLNVTAKE